MKTKAREMAAMVTCVKLLKVFSPVVAEIVDPLVAIWNEDRKKSMHYKPSDDISAHYGVIHIEGGWLYNLRLTFEGGDLFMDELMQLVVALQYFCTFEDGPECVIDDLHFQIGDGDDSTALTFNDGAFQIWVRGWDGT